MTTITDQPAAPQPQPVPLPDLACFYVRVSFDGSHTWNLRNANGTGWVDVDASEMQLTCSYKAIGDALYWNSPIHVWLTGDAVRRARTAFKMNG